MSILDGSEFRHFPCSISSLDKLCPIISSNSPLATSLKPIFILLLIYLPFANLIEPCIFSPTASHFPLSLLNFIDNGTNKLLKPLSIPSFIVLAVAFGLIISG